MRFMNEYEVREARDRYVDHPVLGPATATLYNLMTWTNGNSDGWPYWAKPTRAAEKLMAFIEGGDAFDDERADATEALYAAALRPVKAFRTRHAATFDIVPVTTQAQKDELAASLARTARREEIAVELATSAYASDDVIVHDSLASVDGGYWIAARVWIPAEAVEAKLAE